MVPMTWTDSKGVVFTKEFVLKRGDYAVGVDYKIDNKSAEPVKVQFYGQLKADHDHAEGSGRPCHGGQRLPWWCLLQRRQPLQEVHLRQR